MQKKRSLRANSFFGEFPKVSLGALRVIFSFTQDYSQRRMAENVKLNKNLVSQIRRRLQDFCSMDLQYRPVIPFGGAGAVVKCVESKFNHKAKVTCLKHALVMSLKGWLLTTKPLLWTPSNSNFSGPYPFL